MQVRRVLRDNGLSIAMFGLFFVFLVGQSLAGWHHENEQRQEHGQPALAWSEHVRSGAFLEATFENWESEFLQMASFLVLSAILVQRGAAESRDPDDDQRAQEDEDATRGVAHRGRLAQALYSRSLSIALGLLFVVSFVLHAIGGRAQHNEEALQHGGRTLTLIEFVSSSTFWFQSLQNWQSEFLSVGALVVLSIFLRQKGSPESKPVSAPNSQTGTE